VQIDPSGAPWPIELGNEITVDGQPWPLEVARHE